MKYIKTPLPSGTHLWKTEDFFALRAEPEDRVEFALHHLQSGRYLQYGSIFSSTSDGTLTAESFNVVVDQTVVDSSQSYGYTAQTRSVCQRFTFEKVGTGDNAYYHILPYLRLQTDAANSDTIEIKGSYRSEYRLAVVNGAVKVMQTAEGEDPASGRWILQKTAGGKYRIFNVAENKALTVENNTLTLTSGNAHILWELRAISLAMEKDYQQYTNTCGAASGKMIVNYLTGSALSDDDFIDAFIEVYPDGYDSYINHIATIVNNFLTSGGVSCQYNSSNTYMDQDDLQLVLSNSIQKFYPAIVNVRPHKNLVGNPNVASQQLLEFGYGYDANNDASGHYFVVKGVYYNEKEQRYDSVINETHFKFGATPKNRNSTTNNIGGRDTVVSFDILHKVYEQRNKNVMYME